MHSKAFAKLVSITVVFIVAAGSSRPLLSQEPRTLANATRLKCTFPLAATSDWNSAGDARVNFRKSDLSLDYREIDTTSGTAQAVALNGNQLFITARFVLGTLHLLSIADSGLLSVTSVFSQSAHRGSFKAVHTRNEFISVPAMKHETRPEQFTGECEIAD
jgi:hypothetical protein